MTTLGNRRWIWSSKTPEPNIFKLLWLTWQAWRGNVRAKLRLGVWTMRHEHKNRET